MNTLLKPKGIVIHHSLTKDGKVCDWDAIKRYHMTAPEYMMEAIGYHGGVERVGSEVAILTGRPINRTGGHTKGHNDMLGLCVIGNYDLAPPDEEMLKSAALMCRAWLSMFPHLTSKDIHPHNEYAAKSCPGKLFPWDEFISLVEASAYVA